MVEKYIADTSHAGDKFALHKLFSLSTNGNKSTAEKNNKKTLLLWYGVDSTELLGVLSAGLTSKSHLMPSEM